MKIIKPKKSLGQNFLIDKNIINIITKAGNITKNDIILEVQKTSVNSNSINKLVENIRRKTKRIFFIEIPS